MADGQQNESDQVAREGKTELEAVDVESQVQNDIEGKPGRQRQSVARVTDRIPGTLCKVYNLGIAHTVVHRQYTHTCAISHPSRNTKSTR